MNPISIYLLAPETNETFFVSDKTNLGSSANAFTELDKKH